MPIFRNKKNELPFTQIDNALLEDKRLSYKAIGLLCFMLRQKSGWSFSLEWIASQHKDGVDAVSSGVRELEKFGYIQREREHKADGTFGDTIYSVYETPQPPKPENPVQVEPKPENPILGNPGQEKPGQALYKKPNTIKPNTIPPLTPQGAGPAKHAQAESGGKSDVSLPKWKPERFEAFYRAYPRKDKRKAACRAWDKLKPTEPLLRVMAAALAVQMRSEEWQREAGRYIPMPSSWLNGRRWEDQGIDPPPVPRATAPGEGMGELWT